MPIEWINSNKIQMIFYSSSVNVCCAKQTLAKFQFNSVKSSSMIYIMDP